jgi:hypothetical protein
MTFGNPFGLALYDKTQENVVDDADDRRPVQQQKQAAPVSNPAIDNLWQEINAISSSRGLELFWKDNVKTILGFDDGNRKRFVDKKDELKTKLSPDLVKEIQEEFPGSRVVDEQLRNHPMAAG